MIYPRFALAGVQKSPLENTTPVLLNWHIRMPDNRGATPRDFPEYKRFRLFRITNGVFRRLQNTGFGWLHPVSDFVTVSLGGDSWPPSILYTKAEFCFAEACKLVTQRGAVAIKWPRGCARALRHRL